MYILNPLPLRVRDFFVSVLNRKVTSYTSLRNSIPVLLGSFLKEVYYALIPQHYYKIFFLST